MKREILFRGKRIDNGEWVEGFYCEFANNRTGDQEHFIQTVKKDGRIDIIHKVDPATVGQYTGLTDKNGKRIFEGDVVVCKTTAYTFDPCCVRYGEAWVSFIIEGREGNYRMSHNFEYEVIGNIHDNPELMEVADK